MQPPEQRNIDELAHEVRGMEAGNIQRLSFRAFLGLNTPKQARTAKAGGILRCGYLGRPKTAWQVVVEGREACKVL